MNIHFSASKQIFWNRPSPFNITVMGKSVSTYVAGLRTAYDVIRGMTVYGRKWWWPNVRCYPALSWTN